MPGAIIQNKCFAVAARLCEWRNDERPEIRKLLWRQTLVQAAIFRHLLARNSNMPAQASLAHLFCELFTRAQDLRSIPETRRKRTA